MKSFVEAERRGEASDGSLGRNSSLSPSIRVFGIGGAGCNMVEGLLGQNCRGQHLSVYTVNRIETEREVDLKLASGIDGPLSSEDLHVISESVRPADYVILASGKAGN